MVAAQLGGSDAETVGSHTKGECGMISPTEWIASHRARIEEARRRLVWEPDEQKKKTLRDEIIWREQEIDLLQKKLAS